MTDKILHFLDVLGSPLAIRFAHWSNQIALLAQAFTQWISHRRSETENTILENQIYFTGWQPVSLIGMIAFGIGMLVVLYSDSGEWGLQSGALSVQLLYVIAISELSSLVVGLIVIARSGSAIATEIGNMKVNREFEALQVLAISPVSFVVAPRLVATLISVSGLVVLFCGFATFGNFLGSAYSRGMDWQFFQTTLLQQVRPADLGFLLIKVVGTGVWIGSCTTYHGGRVERSYHEVPQATSAAVVDGILGVVLINISLSILRILWISNRWWGVT